MSEKSSEMPSEVKAKLDELLSSAIKDRGQISDHLRLTMSIGWIKCYDLMIEREAKLKAQLDLAKQHIAFLAVKDGLNNDCTKSYSNGFEDARAAAHRFLQDIKLVRDDFR